MPEPESRRDGDDAEEPQLPRLAAMPQHLPAVADAAECTDADVQAVGQQTEPGEEA